MTLTAENPDIEAHDPREAGIHRAACLAGPSAGAGCHGLAGRRAGRAGTVRQGSGRSARAANRLQRASRIITSTLNEQDSQNVSGELDFEILRARDGTGDHVAAGGTGESDGLPRNAGRRLQHRRSQTPRSNLRGEYRPAPAARDDDSHDRSRRVEQAMADLTGIVDAQKGRIVERHLSTREQNGHINGRTDDRRPMGRRADDPRSRQRRSAVRHRIQPKSPGPPGIAGDGPLRRDAGQLRPDRLAGQGQRILPPWACEPASKDCY